MNGDIFSQCVSPWMTRQNVCDIKAHRVSSEGHEKEKGQLR